MTSQKGVVTAPGRRPGPNVLGGGAQRGPSRRTNGPPPPIRGPARAGPQSTEAGAARAPLRAEAGPYGRGAHLPQASLSTQGLADPLMEGWGTRALQGETSCPEGQSVLSSRAGLNVRPERPGGNRRGPGTACVYT